MTTALKIVTGAAKLLGLVRKGEALDADEAADGLEALNDLLASWSSSSLFLLGRYRESFALTANALHTIGTGQTFDTVAPMQIINAFVRSGGVDYPLMVVTDSEYENIRFKTTQGAQPYCINYSKSAAANVGNIRLYPVPTGGYELHLLSEKQITEIASLNTEVFLPQAGSNRALKSNLALDLAPTYGVQPAPRVTEMAKDSLGAIKRESARQRPLTYEPSSGGIRNIYTGWET